MNKYLALLAAIIVTNSLGGAKIHAKNSDIGQVPALGNTSSVSHTEELPRILLYPPTDNDDTIEEYSTTRTSILTSASGAAIRIKPFISVSKIASEVEPLATLSKTVAKIDHFISVSETSTNFEALTAVSGTAIGFEPFSSTSGAAIEFEPLFSTSSAAINAETIAPTVDTENIQNNTTKQLEKAQKKFKKAKVRKTKYIKMEVPKHNNFKSYMSYRAITCKTSKQYKLQQKAKTGKFGIRTVEGRYLIAMGTYYTKNVGDKFDITLSDGTIIKCMIGDIKADKDTDSKKQKQKYDGSIIEFITDTDKMPSTVKRAGSYTVCKKFSGSIKEIKKVK